MDNEKNIEFAQIKRLYEMKTNKCIYCGRQYIGEGHNDACTSDCWTKKEYAKRHNKPLYYPKKDPFSKPNTKKSDEEYNKKWLETDNETLQKKEENRTKLARKQNEILKKSHLAKERWIGKKFKSIRG